MLTSRLPSKRVRTGSKARTTSWNPPGLNAEDRTWLARMCCRLDERRWIVAVSNVVAAALFVAGCIGFYWPWLYTGSVTAFLVGSVLFLLGALGSALLEHGPST